MADNTDSEHDSISAFRAEFLTVFNQLRENNQLCDVSIVAGEKKLNAHKNVLSAASPYFRKLFTLPVMEADMMEISIPEVDFKTMEQIIQFIYSGKMNLSNETVLVVLNAANFLQMADLVDLCAKYILKQMSATNCLEIKKLLNAVNCDAKIIARTMDYIIANFPQISQNESFLQLDVSNVMELLSSTELCRASEENVRHGAIRWLCISSDRKQHTKEIFNRIRLSLISDKFELLSIANKNAQTSILAIHQGVATSIQLYNTITKKWTKFMDIEANRYMAMTSNDATLILAGYNKSTSCYFFNVLDLKTRQWTSLPGLRVMALGPKKIHALFIVNNELYVIYDVIGMRISAFDMKTNSWSFTYRPTYGRCFTDFGAFGNHIYVLDSTSHQRISQKLDTRTKTWSYIQPIIRNRKKTALHGATTYDGKIYVVRCFFNDEKIEIGTHLPVSFHVYDPVKDEWKELTPMVTKMIGVTLVAGDDGIYAIGRLTPSAPSMVQFYNVTEDTWKIEGICPKKFKGQKVLACAVSNLYVSF